MESQAFTSLSVWPKIKQNILDVQGELKLKSQSETIMVLLAAYDVINGTGHGGVFTEAVKTAMNESRGDKA